MKVIVRKYQVTIKMILKYVDYFLLKDKKKIKNIYTNSFNKDERFSFFILEKCAKEKKCRV